MPGPNDPGTRPQEYINAAKAKAKAALKKKNQSSPLWKELLQPLQATAIMKTTKDVDVTLVRYRVIIEEAVVFQSNSLNTIKALTTQATIQTLKSFLNASLKTGKWVALQ